MVFFGISHRVGADSCVNMSLRLQRVLAYSGVNTSVRALRDLEYLSSTAKPLSEVLGRLLDDGRPNIYTLQEATGLSGIAPLSGKASRIVDL